ncbi:MAG: diguanylate cyclase [Gemmatimonadetes bacterium]|nr:diguanylate cyclase [Gemmatimonadota bacterium]
MAKLALPKDDVSRKAVIRLAAGTAVFLFVAALTVHRIGVLARSDRSTAQSRELIEAVTRVTRLVTDAESGQRAYLLTGDSAYLAPLALADTTAPEVLASIFRLTEREPDQKERLTGLAREYHARMAELRDGVAAYNRGGPAAAARVLETNAGRDAMMRLRAEAGQMARAEGRVLEEAAARARREALWARIVALLALACGIAVPLLPLRALRRAIAAREAAEAARKAHEEYTGSLLENASDILAILDPGGTIRYLSSAAERVLGFNPGELTGRNFFDRLHADDRGMARAVFEERGTSRKAERTAEFRALHKNGSWRHLSARIQNRLDHPGVKGIVVSLQDITEQRRVEEALRESEERYRGLIEMLPEAVIVHSEAAVRYMNPAARELFGYAPDERVVGTPILELVHPDDRDKVWSRIQVLDAEGGATERTEERLLRADGTVIYGEVVERRIWFAGEPAIQAVVRDITARKRLEGDLRRAALRDPLTQLPNRRYFAERLSRALERARRRPDYRFGVLFVDLDRFKSINDTFGHMVGDQLLIGIAERLSASVRPGDVVARLGGDEFAVVLPTLLSTEDAARVGERLVEAFRDPFHIEGHEVKATVSVGVAIASDRFASVDDLLRAADRAMYAAKGGGRDRCILIDEVEPAAAPDA